MDAQFITPEQGQRFARIVSTIVDDFKKAEQLAERADAVCMAAMENAVLAGLANASEDTHADIEWKRDKHNAAVLKRDSVERDIDDLLAIVRIEWPEDFPHVMRFCRTKTTDNRAALDLEIEILQTRFERAAIFAALPRMEPAKPASEASEPVAIQQSAQLADDAANPSQKKAKPSPWHDFGVSPPSDFRWSLTGLKKDLTWWILEDNKKGAHRGLDSKLKNGSLWGQQGKGDNWIVWFKDQRSYSQANTRRLADEAGNTKEHPETV